MKKLDVSHDRIVGVSADSIRKELGYTYHKCVVCGKKEVNNQTSNRGLQLKKFKICFNCNFWWEKINLRIENDQRAIVVDGKHFFIDEESVRGMRGFSGHRFTIRYTTGLRKDNVVVTTNLWSQGEIPERFRDILTDNAIFITEDV